MGEVCAACVGVGTELGPVANRTPLTAESCAQEGDWQSMGGLAQGLPAGHALLSTPCSALLKPVCSGEMAAHGGFGAGPVHRPGPASNPCFTLS